MRARFPEADAVIFGHCTCRCTRPARASRFNPGSPTEWWCAPAHTMGLARVSGGEVAFAGGARLTAEDGGPTLMMGAVGPSRATIAAALVALWVGGCGGDEDSEAPEEISAAPTRRRPG